MTTAFFIGLTESVDAKYSKPCSFAYSAVFVNLVLMQTAAFRRVGKARDRRKVIFVAITDFNDIKPEFRLIDVNFQRFKAFLIFAFRKRVGVVIK